LLCALQAWRRFCEALPETAVGYLFVSEQHLAGTDLKQRMRDAIRANRRCAALLLPCAVLSCLLCCCTTAWLCEA